LLVGGAVGSAFPRHEQPFFKQLARPAARSVQEPEAERLPGVGPGVGPGLGYGVPSLDGGKAFLDYAQMEQHDAWVHQPELLASETTKAVASALVG
jgi:hypothetical protein